jgi:hypothetical protein
MKHWIYKESTHFKNSYLFNNELKYKCDALGKFWIFCKTSYKNFHSKIHLHVKVIFGKKYLQSFSKVTLLAPSYKFTTFVKKLGMWENISTIFCNVCENKCSLPCIYLLKTLESHSQPYFHFVVVHLTLWNIIFWKPLTIRASLVGD